MTKPADVEIRHEITVRLKIPLRSKLSPIHGIIRDMKNIQRQKSYKEHLKTHWHRPRSRDLQLKLNHTFRLTLDPALEHKQPTMASLSYCKMPRTPAQNISGLVDLRKCSPILGYVLFLGESKKKELPGYINIVQANQKSKNAKFALMKILSLREQ